MPVTGAYKKRTGTGVPYYEQERLRSAALSKCSDTLSQLRQRVFRGRSFADGRHLPPRRLLGDGEEENIVSGIRASLKAAEP